MLELDQIGQKASEEINASDNVEALDALRVHYLGKKGVLTEQLKSLGQLSAEERPKYGQAVNQVKQQLQTLIQTKKDALIEAKLAQKLAAESIDVTLPGRRQSKGSFHPITQTRQRIEHFFGRLGFSLQDGPEIEDDFHNFSALNIPAHHPARDMHDTFYFDAERVLRTHTSNVQIRVMENSEPPVQVISAGRVYRCDYDVTHTPMFHQVEGLWIDKNINFSHLKGVLDAFVQDFFEKDVKTRFRSSYFPFTEPSAEMDVECVKCSGKGCRICSHTGWLEILGCGMVHPNVLKAVNIDSEKYVGFAFGMGVERLTMLRYAIDDIRLYFENDQRFLNQF